MFINKLYDKSNSSKMSSYINLFLKTEITCIPKLLKNYLGNYYSNALCNGATWVFALWCVLHVIFDKVIDELLRKLRYREYVRIRLKNCLWYLGFYGTALVYCGATLAQNEVELFNLKKMHVPSGSGLPTQVMLGYTLISTFYLHSALWEGLTKESFVRMFNYLFLFAFLVSSYILRIVEISFTLTALIGVAQVAIEFTRCCFMTSNQDTLLSKIILGLIYFVTFAIYFALYIIIIPLTFVVPFGLKLMSDYPNILLLFLFINLVSWLITDIYQSILFRFVDHWFYHEEDTKDVNTQQCSGGFLECSLFKQRDDISYNLQILREEIKSRETKMMSMRKPKNKSMLIQTLKCMVAIKRKLSEKRLSESSDSDDSEKSEDSDLKTSENTDEDVGKRHSDPEEETDDEESESQESVIDTKKVCKDNPQKEAKELESKCDSTKETANIENVDLSKQDNPINSGTEVKSIAEPKIDVEKGNKNTVSEELAGCSINKNVEVVPANNCHVKSVEEPNMKINKEGIEKSNELSEVNEGKVEPSINENDELVPDGGCKAPQTVNEEAEVVVEEATDNTKKKVEETSDIGSSE